MNLELHSIFKGVSNVFDMSAANKIKEKHEIDFDPNEEHLSEVIAFKVFEKKPRPFPRLEPTV